jgi:trans-aconitate 2-methyltransferase
MNEREDGWEPQQYERFREERRQPFFDLLALCRPVTDMRVVDLGCGTGDLTRLLHERLRARETIGLDRSEAMLTRSDACRAQGLSFVRGEIERFAAHREYDLVFSNAALQWVAAHEELLPRLAGALRGPGQLAIQVPANHAHPSHQAVAEVAAESPFREALRGFVRQVPVLAPEVYAAQLEQLGFAEQNVRLQVYAHRLASRDELVEWVKGTVLTAYRERLSADLYDRFLVRYRARLAELVADARPYLLLYPRILMWGRRRSG